ncbi:hypothetical protein QUA70_20095 [Microcoleus sp. LAD1_D5]|uniref:hypothetical protein n=1 Tax=unclassified Microcoleus TaxID=2642155 RepID=UPI002FCF1260
MEIEGKIMTVMESWPLQLTVQTQTALYHVVLRSDTQITQQGKEVNPGSLRPDLPVRIGGQVSSSNPLAMNAEAIEVLE